MEALSDLLDPINISLDLSKHIHGGDFDGISGL